MKNPFLSLVHFIDLPNHLYIHYPGPRWAVVGGYLLTIYLTLPVTPLLSKSAFRLFGRKETGIIISLVLLVIMTAAIVLLFRRIKKEQRTKAVLPFLALVGLASILDNPVERVHFLEYGILAFLLFRASGRPYGMGLVWVFVAVLVAGFADEIIQWILPNRYFDIKDVAINGIGAAIGLWFGTMMRRPEHALETNQSPPSASQS